MFGNIDRITKDCNVFYVLNNSRNNKMKIIKENVSSNENEDMDIDEEYTENTHIYSDYFPLINLIHFETKVILLKG